MIRAEYIEGGIEEVVRERAGQEGGRLLFLLRGWCGAAGGEGEAQADAEAETEAGAEADAGSS